MTSLSFTVYAVPIAQPRAKATTIHGHARMYEAKKSHAIHTFKAAAAMAASQAHDGGPLDGSLGLSALFLLPRPKAKVWKTRPMPRYYHTTRPDIDNLLKGLMDALSGIIWKDDTQISLLSDTYKMVASGYEKPHVEVSVWELEGGESR